MLCWDDIDSPVCRAAGVDTRTVPSTPTAFLPTSETIEGAGTPDQVATGVGLAGGPKRPAHQCDRDAMPNTLGAQGEHRFGRTAATGRPEPTPKRDHIARTSIRRTCRQTIRDIRLLHPSAQRAHRDLKIRRGLLERRIRTTGHRHDVTIELQEENSQRPKVSAYDRCQPHSGQTALLASGSCSVPRFSRDKV